MNLRNIILLIIFITYLNLNLNLNYFNYVKNCQLKLNTFKTNKLKLNQFLNPNDSLVTGQFKYEVSPYFRVVSEKYSNKKIYLQKIVADSFESMCKQALKNGVLLKAISGVRSFQVQKNIWDRKWELNKNKDTIEIIQSILKYSAMPMCSRHHWGTDIDINNLENKYFEKKNGLKEYNWLKLNAKKFGFCQVYTNKVNGRKGYEEEKWHWSFMPISKIYLDYYNKNINYNKIKGFKGFNKTKIIKIIEDYVNGIESNCINKISLIKKN